MFDAKEMLRRQEAWQASRRLLPWPEKLRLAVAMRETVLVFAELRAAARRETPAPDQGDQQKSTPSAG
jgi:hypothetical protein